MAEDNHSIPDDGSEFTDAASHEDGDTNSASARPNVADRLADDVAKASLGDAGFAQASSAAAAGAPPSSGAPRTAEQPAAARGESGVAGAGADGGAGMHDGWEAEEGNLATEEPYEEPPGDGPAADSGSQYDETLPDGRTFRRRRREKMEADELDDDKKDSMAATAFKEEGNRHYGSGDYDTATACYTEALRHLPRAETYDSQRAIYYGNRAACHLAQSRLEDTVYDCDRALEYNEKYTKALARRSAALERLGKLDEALKDMTRLLELEPDNRTARESIPRLEAATKERDEKLKAEMLGKLKDLGNMVLGKFGLSTDNFKFVQDPNTGSYSISFQR